MSGAEVCIVPSFGEPSPSVTGVTAGDGSFSLTFEGQGVFCVRATASGWATAQSDWFESATEVDDIRVGLDGRFRSWAGEGEQLADDGPLHGAGSVSGVRVG